VKAAVLLLAVIMLGAALMVLSASRLEGFRGVAVILVGPLPIFIDVSDPSQAILLALPFIIALLPLIFIFVAKRGLGPNNYPDTFLLSRHRYSK
jgi:uncharacterized membrane protein